MAEVRIAGFEMQHWADVAELFLAPECCWGTLQLPLQSRDDIKKRLETPPQNFRRLVALTSREPGAEGSPERAIKLYEKFDFEVEGTLRRFARRDGEYVDVLSMGRLV